MISSATQRTTLAGLGCVVAAVIVGWTPWFPGVGLFWSVVMLGGALVLAGAAQRNTTPRGALAWLPAFYAALVACHALQNLGLGLVPLLWLVGALLLGSEQRRAFKASGAAARLDVAGAKRGYRVYIVMGALLCFASLWGRWGHTDPWTSFGWNGGMRSTLTSVSSFNPSSGSYEMQLQPQMQYDPMMYPNNWSFPGAEWSGMAQRGVIGALLSLGLLGAWALLRRDEALFARYKWGAAALAVWLSLWFLPRAEAEWSVRLFACGLLLIDFAVYQLVRGHESGPFDIAALRQRLGEARAARRVS